MPSSPPRLEAGPGRPRIARAPVLVALAVAGVLLGSGAMLDAAARNLLIASVHGRGEVLAEMVRSGLRSTRHGPPSERRLDTLWAELEAAGVRYLALERPDGPTLSRGRPSVEAPPIVGLVVRGEVARLVTRLPPPRRESGRPEDRRRPAGHPPGGPDPRLGPPGFPPGVGPGGDPGFGLVPGGVGGPDLGAAPPPGRAPGPGGGPLVVLEFTPAAALAFQRRLATMWAVVSLAALVVLGLGILFGRALGQQAELSARLARDQQLAALGEMSAVLAHELRNPLTALKGHAQLAQEAEEEGSPRWRRADRVVREALRLERLIDELLDFVRTQTVRRSPVDPRALLAEAAERFGPERVVLADTQEAPPPPTPLDRDRLRQVLDNLIDNAVQATPEGAAPVELRARRERGGLVIEVRDHGPGLPPGEAELIFRPFHTRRIQGTGLGLALCRRIVEAHGGTISARSHPEGGAELRIELPEVSG